MGYRTVRLDALVVALGHFNPAIVTPDWLCRQQLISESERDESLTKMQAIVAQGVMAFESSWFSFRVLQNQMVLATTAGVTPRIRDLAVGVFTVLPETPLTAMGMNFVSDIQFDSAEEYHRVGDKLAPKDFWQALVPSGTPGLSMLQIAIDKHGRVQASAAPGPVDQRRYTIRPSELANTTNSVNIAFNDHRVLDSSKGARDAVRVLTADWKASQEDAEAAFGKLAQLSEP